MGLKMPFLTFKKMGLDMPYALKKMAFSYSQIPSVWDWLTLNPSFFILMTYEEKALYTPTPFLL